MKRKLFSAILFGALLTASTSGLTSCKDYDDDISNLQSQIDKLATKEELKLKAEDLEGKIKTAQNAADAANEVAKAAKAAAEAAATSGDVAAAKDAAIAAANEAATQAIADLKKELEGSLASKQDLEQAAKAAEKVVTDLKSSLVGDSGLTIDQVMAIVNDAVAKVNYDKTGLDALEARLAAVESKLTPEGSEEEIDLTEIQEELDLIEAALIELVGDVQNMPTSIELVKNYMYNQDNVRMNFTLFEEQKNEFGKDYLASPVNFTKGATKFNSSSVLIRVNPVNADITNKVNNISLINSQGKEISDIVKVKSVSRFNGKLETWGAGGSYTRSVDQTGLWVVEFEPVEGKSAQELKNAFVTEYFWGQQTAQQWRYINYAVSLNNVAGADTLNTSFDETRRLVTAYDVTMDYKKANSYDADPYWETHGKFITHTPGQGETWTPWNEPVNIIPLSFTTSAGTQYIEQVNNRASDLVWKKSYTGTDANNRPVDVITPAVNVTTSTDNGHANDYNSFTGDSRSGRNIVAKVGEKIYIDFNKTYGTQTMPIKGFFVVLDGKNAELTSAPSEINAWNSYVYENVGKVDSDAKLLTINGVKQYSTFQEGNSGYITIKDLYGEATGDEIGFRVYAVNLDGTLVDPDGIAFYVTVGQSASDINIGANTVTVVDNATYTPAYNFNKGTLNGISRVDWTISLSWDQVVSGINYSVEYHVNGGSTWEAYNTANAANYDGVRFKLTGPQYFQDNATFAISGAAKIAATATAIEYTKFTMGGSLTKALPQTAPGFTWNEGQNEEQIVKTTGYDSNIETALQLRGVSAPLTTNVSIKADLNTFVANNQKDGNLNYNDMFIQTKSGNPAINADNKFIFALANTKFNNDTQNFTDALSTSATGSSAPYAYNATIKASLVDCATPHALTCDYNYGKITSQKDENGNFIDYKVSASTGYNIKYMSWSYKNANYLTFTWAKGNNGQSGNNYREWTYDVNQTLTNIQIATDRFATVYGSKLTTNLRKATLKDYIKAGWLQIVSVKTVGVESGIENPYYEWDPSTTYTDYTVLGLKKKAGVENIPAHSEKVQITVIDCFGHKETHEFILKFTIEPVDHVLTPTA